MVNNSDESSGKCFPTTPNLLSAKVSSCWEWWSLLHLKLYNNIQNCSRPLDLIFTNLTNSIFIHHNYVPSIITVSCNFISIALIVLILLLNLLMIFEEQTTFRNCTIKLVKWVEPPRRILQCENFIKYFTELLIIKFQRLIDPTSLKLHVISNTSSTSIMCSFPI